MIFSAGFTQPFLQFKISAEVWILLLFCFQFSESGGSSKEIKQGFLMTNKLIQINDSIQINMHRAFLLKLDSS